MGKRAVPAGLRLDAVGLRLATQVVPGNTADDPLYVPAIDRVPQIIDGVGLLFVGECKMSALSIRTHFHHLEHHYLYLLAQTGKTAEEKVEWIERANAEQQGVQAIYVENAKGENKLLAEGYEFQRLITSEVSVDKPDGSVSEKKPIQWTERVIVIRSESYRQAQAEGLEGRLQRATEELMGLTSKLGRCKRQIQSEAQLVEAAEAILKARDVEGLLDYTFERHKKRRTQYQGRGRGGANRPTEEIVQARYQVTTILRREEAIDKLKKTLCWRVYVINVPIEQLSLEQAVLTYREVWLIERGFSSHGQRLWYDKYSGRLL